MKQRYKYRSIAFKLMAVALAERTTANGAARTLKVDQSRVREWRSQKAKLEELLKQPGGRKKYANNVASREMEEVLVSWVTELRAAGVNLTRTMLRNKAREVFAQVEDAGRESFNASIGWAIRFMKKHGLEYSTRPYSSSTSGSNNPVEQEEEEEEDTTTTPGDSREEEGGMVVVEEEEKIFMETPFEELVKRSEALSQPNHNRTVEFKLKAVELAERTTCNGAAQELWVSGWILRDWMKNKKKLEEQLKSGHSGPSRRPSGKKRRKTLPGRRRANKGTKLAKKKEMEEEELMSPSEEEEEDKSEQSSSQEGMEEGVDCGMKISENSATGTGNPHTTGFDDDDDDECHVLDEQEDPHETSPPPPPASPCLICSSPTETAADSAEDSGGCGSEQFLQFISSMAMANPEGNVSPPGLHPHLYSIFVLRKLLNLPKSEVEGLLASMSGVHPGDWYRLCGSCSTLVDQCADVCTQISLLQQKLLDFRAQAYKSLQRSFIGDELTDESDGNFMCARDAVRDYFKGFLSDSVDDDDYLAEEEWADDDGCPLESMDCEEEPEPPLQPPQPTQNRKLRPRTHRQSKSKSEKPKSNDDDDDEIGSNSANDDHCLSEPEEVADNDYDDDDYLPPQSQDSDEVDEEDEDADDNCLSESFEHSEEDPPPPPQPQPPKRAKINDKKCVSSKRSIQHRKKILKKLQKNNTGSKSESAEDHEEGSNSSNSFFQCEKCGFSCRSSALQNYHVRMHKLDDNVVVLESGDFSCNLCLPSSPLEAQQVSWKSRGDVHLHLRSSHREHLGLPVYTCTTCSRHFTSKNQLQLHTAKMHDDGDDADRNWKGKVFCENCGVFFRHRNVLERHIKAKHSEDNNNKKKKKKRKNYTIKKEPWICDICGKTLSKKQGLEVHKAAVHGNLSKEEKAIYNRKLGKCKLCDFHGRSKDVLKRHLRKAHPDTFTFQCFSCHMTYSRASDLEKHEKRYHQQHQHDSSNT